MLCKVRWIQTVQAVHQTLPPRVYPSIEKTLWSVRVWLRDNIHHYLIKRRVCKDQDTARKPFECVYCIYNAMKLISIAIYSPTTDNLTRVSSIIDNIDYVTGIGN